MGAAVGYLGLGSNEGERESNLLNAVGELNSEDGVDVLACSSLYETEPVGEIAEQRDFINAALKIQTVLGPAGLLGVCKSIEARLGRDLNGLHHGPRVIDIDILLLDGVEGEFECSFEGLPRKLALPHFALRERRFVLVPLLELEPDLRHPDGTALSSVLTQLGRQQRTEKVGELLCS